MEDEYEALHDALFEWFQLESKDTAVPAVRELAKKVEDAADQVAIVLQAKTPECDHLEAHTGKESLVQSGVNLLPAGKAGRERIRLLQGESDEESGTPYSSKKRRFGAYKTKAKEDENVKGMRDLVDAVRVHLPNLDPKKGKAIRERAYKDLKAALSQFDDPDGEE